MKNTANGIAFISELEQSEVFGRDYEEILKIEGSAPALGYFFKDIADLLNNILLKCNELSDYQITVLYQFFLSLNDIRKTIDPNRLDSFSSVFNEDNELVLFRNNNKGLINLIINPEECFAFSYIPKDVNGENSLDFYYEDFDDFEGLAYKFFS